MERLEILKNVLEGLETEKYNFICNAIFFISGEEATKLFPELLNFKPEDKKLHRTWWEFDKVGRQQRIYVIKQLIKILENETS